jgi:LmbE family N-acetylglucosaminyl deacetylase
MQSVQFNKRRDGPFTILCLGAHCDDVEIGCGGAILRLLEEIEDARVWWIIFTSDPRRAEEARRSADLFLEKASSKKVEVHGLETSFLPFAAEQVKRKFEHLKSECSPDLIFTHYRHDLHQDHRVICDLTWNTFRNHLILEYEILKYDGDIGTPNFFIHLGEEVSKKKVDHILECFPSQRDKHWFTSDAFYALMRLRGIESCAPERYAEAFYCRKVSI